MDAPNDDDIRAEIEDLEEIKDMLKNPMDRSEVDGIIIALRWVLGEEANPMSYFQ